MPTYEYECRTCGYSFERVQNMSDDPVKDCPECGKPVRRIIFGGSGVIFKGTGFYVNDSRGKNSAAPAAAKSNSGDASNSGGSSSGDKPSGDKSAGEKSAGEKSAGDKPSGEKSATATAPKAAPARETA